MKAWTGKLIIEGEPIGVPTDSAHSNALVIDRPTCYLWEFDSASSAWVKQVPA